MVSNKNTKTSNEAQKSSKAKLESLDTLKRVQISITLLRKQFTHVSKELKHMGAVKEDLINGL